MVAQDLINPSQPEGIKKASRSRDLHKACWNHKGGGHKEHSKNHDFAGCQLKPFIALDIPDGCNGQADGGEEYDEPEKRSNSGRWSAN